MDSSLLHRLPNIPQILLKNYHQHPKPQRFAIATALIAISAPVTYLIYADYRAWLLVGPGGLPHNFLGYLIQSLLRPLKAKPFDTSCYTDPRILVKSGPHGETAYLSDDDIPLREGERPQVCKWILPQRQLDAGASQAAKDKYESLVRSLAASHPSTLIAGTSVLERSGLALFVSPSVTRHAGAHWTRREIAHNHPKEGSMHISLSPLDAKLVIDKGWGQRFGLSGTVLPVTYVMVYAPREGENEEEDVKIVEKIVGAAVKFMLGEEK